MLRQIKLISDGINSKAPDRLHDYVKFVFQGGVKSNFSSVCNTLLDFAIPVEEKFAFCFSFQLRNTPAGRTQRS